MPKRTRPTIHDDDSSDEEDFPPRNKRETASRTSDEDGGGEEEISAKPGMDVKIAKVQKKDKGAATSSLLTNMAPPSKPPPEPTQRKPYFQANRGRRPPFNRFPPPTGSGFDGGTLPPQQRSASASSRSNTPPPPSMNTAGKVQYDDNATADTNATSTGAIARLPLAAQEKVLLARLQNLCHNMVDTDPTFQLPPSPGYNRVIDVNASFLPESSRLDFLDAPGDYDFNVQTGEVITTTFLPASPTNEISLAAGKRPSIPMFPEDFADKTKEHSLAWWGIQTYQQGKDKFAPPPSPPAAAYGYRRQAPYR